MLQYLILSTNLIESKLAVSELNTIKNVNNYIEFKKYL